MQHKQPNYTSWSTANDGQHTTIHKFLVVVVVVMAVLAVVVVGLRLEQAEAPPGRRNGGDSTTK